MTKRYLQFCSLLLVSVSSVARLEAQDSPRPLPLVAPAVPIVAPAVPVAMPVVERVQAAQPTQSAPSGPPGIPMRTRDPLFRMDEPLTPRDPLRRPSEPEAPKQEIQPVSEQVLTAPLYDKPLGYSGKSSVIPRSGSNDDFVTVEDRWRIGMPEWDRYNLKYPNIVDYAYRLGRWSDPYNLNWIKGDYPIYGQHTFLNLTGTTVGLFEGRQLPTATTPFESTQRPFSQDFFGRPNSFLYSQFFSFSADLFHGDAGFKPADWRIKITPTFNVNYLNAQELAVVSPDVSKGTSRGRSWMALQEWFAEYKLADLSSEYDFVSARVGSQPFVSDFRGFLYSDINRGARLFGTLNGNRDQYNLVYFRQQEKDTNSGLNMFQDRNQNVAIANWYHQDFLFPGYTIQSSFHYNNDGPSFLYDKNKFLVRPDPVGVYLPHRVEAYYLGFAGDGHIDRFNVSHAFYWALGRDSYNPLAGQPQSISAQMAAAEVSYDRDWARFRVSSMWASGDGNINNGRATGFDGIMSNMVFAGETSFFNRQQIPLFGVGLTNRNSLFPSLRSSGIQGQSNFVNPGLWLLNLGFDADITPRARVVNNVNFLWFDKTSVLEQFTYQANVSRAIGTDFSTSIEYRPLLNNNVIMLAGVSTLVPSAGFREIYNKLNGPVNPLVMGFLEVILTY